jgi:L,D-transpeptidase catalytic domain
LKSGILTLLFAVIVCVLTAPWFGRGESIVDASPVHASEVTRRVASVTFATALDPLLAEAAGVSPDVLEMALGAVQCAVAHGNLAVPPTLTLIDYSRPSVEPRLWVFDLASRRLLFKELVAHGRNSGDNMSTRFSDEMNSHQSSLGLFVTGDTYVGSNGYSLRLDGLEPGFNGRARDRAIVMHGAPYVNAALSATQGRIGRSWGCPALREAVARDVIDTIRGGGVIFSYYPDDTWLSRSRFLGGCARDGEAATMTATKG